MKKFSENNNSIFQEIVTKKLYCSVGVLEYISTNLLKVTLQELDLSTNAVKNDLFHKQIFRSLRLAKPPQAPYNMALMISLFFFAMVKFISRLSFP